MKNLKNPDVLNVSKIASIKETLKSPKNILIMGAEPYLKNEWLCFISEIIHELTDRKENNINNPNPQNILNKKILKFFLLIALAKNNRNDIKKNPKNPTWWNPYEMPM